MALDEERCLGTRYLNYKSLQDHSDLLGKAFYISHLWQKHHRWEQG